MVTLRTRIILRLLPVAIAILVFAYGYYNAREEIITEHIAQSALLASTVGGKELNHFIRTRNSEFKLLAKVISNCHQSSTTDLESLSISALRYTQGFSAIAIANSQGNIIHTELSANDSNRYILRQDASNERLLPAPLQQELDQRYKEWQSQLPEAKKQLASLENSMSSLKARGEQNSQHYRDTLLQVFNLRELIEAPPSLVSFTGRAQTLALGLPFTNDTFLFSQPRIDCNGNLTGYFAAYLDRTQIEDILYNVKLYLIDNGLTQTDIALLKNNTLQLLTETRFLHEKTISAYELKPNIKPKGTDHLGGVLVSKPVADATFFEQHFSNVSSQAATSQQHTLWNNQETGLSLLVFISNEEIRYRTAALLVEVSTWSALLLLAFLTLIYFLSGNIVKPLIDLTKSAESLMRGELKPSAHLHQRTDEIGELLLTFDQMANTLKSKEEQLLKLAAIDPLTGCLNRRSLFTIAHEEHERAERSHTPLTVCMLDLDHFKLINDQFGHNIGDQVLKQFSDSVFKNLRTGDKLGRVGGEEFVVILPSTELDSAVSIAERIRKSVADMSINNSQTANIKISVSIGVCEWKLGEKFESAVSRADTLLYKAKAAGRNLVAS
jgi:diguanylate cyclase (GGDEF)-like protein